MTHQARNMAIVVDDDDSMRHAIERLLDAAGWDVLSFSSAEDLLSSCMLSGATVLVLDILLPGISGIELKRRLDMAGITPPTVFITAQDRSSTWEMVRQTGATAYLTKPFPGDELLKAILPYATGKQLPHSVPYTQL